MYESSSGKCYENDKGRLLEKLMKDVIAFLKKKKWQYSHVQYKNLSKDEKQKLAEYRKKKIKWEKNAL